jgi:uncharacterized circularly permuted ATP-grasp superfamily protein
MNFYNEMMDANGGVRAHYKGYDDWLKATPPERIARKRAEADLAFHRVGITFRGVWRRGRQRAPYSL